MHAPAPPGAKAKAAPSPSAGAVELLHGGLGLGFSQDRIERHVAEYSVPVNTAEHASNSKDWKDDAARLVSAAPLVWFGRLKLFERIGLLGLDGRRFCYWLDIDHRPIRPRQQPSDIPEVYRSRPFKPRRSHWFEMLWRKLERQRYRHLDGPPSIAEYVRIHAAGWRLNHILWEELNPDGELTDEEAEEKITPVQRQANSEIRKAIRRVEKTKAGIKWSGDIAQQEQLRRIFIVNTARLDRALKKHIPRQRVGSMVLFCGRNTRRYDGIYDRLINRDDVIVPRWWPMQWLRSGVYVPLDAPHYARRVGAKPRLDQIDRRGSKADWARFRGYMGSLDARQLFEPDEQEQAKRGRQMLRVLISRQRGGTRISVPRTVFDPLCYTESESRK
jgi:hypothetical protein